eukprot:TRINITY_DN49745_c0_g1_i1.p1 TRINITY_DN49745_c0_g1~~TRINITY_DN49745_c0_g1_i1.p1  ORF type:complete len:334 (+),score=52.52 TRINITY_DN49745_c0_g1_i1:54-1004(+)
MTPFFVPASRVASFLVPRSLATVAGSPARRMFAATQRVSTSSHVPNLLSDLQGKVIVVAGAGNPPVEGNGIGATTSLTLARQGAIVVSVSDVPENCETVTAAVEHEGNIGMSHVSDCTNIADCKQLLDAVLLRYGKVDVLINAGIHCALPMGFAKMTPEKWDNGIAVNLNAHFNLIHTFLPTFQAQRRGNIIHFSTFGGNVALGLGNQRHSYFAGKAAAAVLTRRIGVENAKNGIRGNVVSIGYTVGPLIHRAMAKVGADVSKRMAIRDAYVPRGRQLVPEEVANVAAFLASDASSGMNAAEVFVDGGNHTCTYGP